MFLVVKENETRISGMEFESNEDTRIAEYGTGGLGSLTNSIGLVTEQYHQLCKMGINSELLSHVRHIVEMLHNLKHFHIEVKGKEEPELIEEIMSKFDSFKYQALENLDIPTDFFKLFNVVNIKSDEDKKSVIDGEDGEYGIYKREENGKVKLSLISRNETPRIISVLEDGEASTIVREIKDALMKLSSSSSNERLFLRKYAFFTMSRGMHSDISAVIEHLMETFNYILNCYSFRKNEYSNFDSFEIRRRLDFDLDTTLRRCKNVATYQLEMAQE